jgi:dTDP-4-dehydrorhamnose 3,5-epimerase
VKVTRLAIPDVCLIEPVVVGDGRGFFMCTWNDEMFRREVCDVAFMQDNSSRSRQWTLRGLHFQARHTQGKLVRCSVGHVWDVAVDVRASSPTFGAWVGTELSGDNHHQLWIPPGFAHGFVVLSELADIEYKVTDSYDPGSERTLQWNDPALGIPWPVPNGVGVILSPKDQAGIPLASLEPLP